MSAVSASCNAFQQRETVLAYMGPKQLNNVPPIELSEGIYIKAETVNCEVARLFLCNQDGTPLPIKTGLNTIIMQPFVCELKNMSTENAVELYKNEWLISWSSNYNLMQGDTCILSIFNERFQSIIKHT